MRILSTYLRHVKKESGRDVHPLLSTLYSLCYPPRLLSYCLFSLIFSLSLYDPCTWSDVQPLREHGSGHYVYELACFSKEPCDDQQTKFTESSTRVLHHAYSIVQGHTWNRNVHQISVPLTVARAFSLEFPLTARNLIKLVPQPFVRERNTTGNSTACRIFCEIIILEQCRISCELLRVKLLYDEASLLEILRKPLFQTLATCLRGTFTTGIRITFCQRRKR